MTNFLDSEGVKHLWKKTSSTFQKKVWDTSNVMDLTEEGINIASRGNINITSTESQASGGLHIQNSSESDLQSIRLTTAVEKTSEDKSVLAIEDTQETTGEGHYGSIKLGGIVVVDEKNNEILDVPADQLIDALSGSDITIDESLSESSSNPIQNQAITKALYNTEYTMSTAINDLNANKVSASLGKNTRDYEDIF